MRLCMASRMAEAVEPAGLTEGEGAFGGFVYLFGFFIVCLLVYLRSDNIIYLLFYVFFLLFVLLRTDFIFCLFIPLFKSFACVYLRTGFIHLYIRLFNC